MAKRRGRGEGSIYFDEERQLWVGQASLGVNPLTGKRLRVTAYGKTKKEARDKLEEEKRKAGTGDARARTITVAEYLEEWLAAVEASDGTRKNYTTSVRNHLVPYLPGRLQALRPLDVQKLWGRLREAGVGDSARHEAGARLKQALRQAVRLGLIPRNPCEDVAIPRYVPGLVRPLTEEELPVFLDHARHDRHYTLYVTAVDSGARMGELLALEWTDLRGGELHITKQLIQMRSRALQRVAPVKTKGSNRRVPLTPETLHRLEEHRQAQGAASYTGPLMFPDAKGLYEHDITVRSHMRTVLAQARLPETLTFHDLRHTCATLLLARGVNVKVVSERLGHSHIRMTLTTYAHVLPSMQTAAVGAMSSILAESLQIGSKQAANADWIVGQLCLCG